MAYDIDFAVMADLKFHVKKFFLHSKSWEASHNQLSFPLNWNSVKFEDINQKHVPLKKGIYAFTVKPEYAGLFETNYLFYIGKTNRTLRSRFGEYIDDGKGKNKPRQKVFTMLKMYKGYLHFNFAPLPNSVEVDYAEEQLLNTFMPHINVVVPIAKIKPEYQYLYE